MTTTPPEQPPTTTETTTRPAAPWGNMPEMARLPLPGNAEFALYAAAVIVAWLVCWIADDLTAGSWLDFFKWATVAYLLSRGIAKASRVLEQ